MNYPNCKEEIPTNGKERKNKNIRGSRNVINITNIDISMYKAPAITGSRETN